FEVGPNPFVEHEAHVTHHRVEADIAREAPGDCRHAALRLEGDRGAGCALAAEVERHLDFLVRLEPGDRLLAGTDVGFAARPVHGLADAVDWTDEGVFGVRVAFAPRRPFIETTQVADDREDSRSGCRAIAPPPDRRVPW